MRTFHRITRGLTALFTRQQDDEELREELRTFLETAIEAKVADGMSRADAERAARLELGSAPAVEDWVRDAGWESRLESVWQDVRYAVRSLRRAPGFTLAAVATLGVGLGAASATYAIVHAVLLAPLPYPDGDRILQVRLRDRERGLYGAAAGTIAALRRLPSVTAAAGAVGAERTLTGIDVPLLVSGEATTEEFFDVLGSRPAIGRTFGPADRGRGPVVVLSHQLWHQAFAGRADAVGRTVALSGIAHEVIGVMPPYFTTPHGFEAEFWILRPFPATELAQEGRGPYSGIVRVRTADLGGLSAQAAGLLPASVTAAGLSLALAPLLDTVREWYGRILWSLLAAVGVVLLLCCVNVANLLFARARTREVELTIRGAIGASRARLMRQMITESIVLAVPAALVGWMLAEAMARAVALLPAPNLFRAWAVVIGADVLPFMVASTVCAVLVFGIWPAIAASRDAAAAVSKRTQTSGGMRRSSQLLIGFEIAATVALLAGAGLVGRRIADILDVEAGFDTRDLRIASIRPTGAEYRGSAAERFYTQVMARIRERTGLEVVHIDRVPLDRWRARPVTVRTDGNADQASGLRVMSPGSLGLLGVDIRRGRDFSDGDDATAVVNETLASRLWGDTLPVGQALTLMLDDKPHPLRVVGIARDMRDGLYRPPGPEIYVSSSQFPSAQTSLVFRSPRPEAELTDAIRRAVMDVDPRQAIAPVISIAELTLTYTALSRFVGILLGMFAALATLLAVTGILAVASGTVASRRRELGIRIAIGATPRDVLGALGRDLLPAVAIGAIAGLAIAASLVQVLRWLVPDVAQFDPLAYGGATLVIIFIAIAGAWIPARRALAIAPTLVLTE
jgi:predicted permease